MKKFFFFFKNTPLAGPKKGKVSAFSDPKSVTIAHQLLVGPSSGPSSSPWMPPCIELDRNWSGQLSSSFLPPAAPPYTARCRDNQTRHKYLKRTQHNCLHVVRQPDWAPEDTPTVVCTGYIGSLHSRYSAHHGKPIRHTRAHTCLPIAVDIKL